MLLLFGVQKRLSILGDALLEMGKSFKGGLRNKCSFDLLNCTSIVVTVSLFSSERQLVKFNFS